MSIFEPDGLPDVLDHLVHIQRDNDPASHIIGVIEIGFNPDLAGPYDLFHERYNLRDQDVLVTAP